MISDRHLQGTLMADMSCGGRLTIPEVIKSSEVGANRRYGHKNGESDEFVEDRSEISSALAWDFRHIPYHLIVL